MKAPFQLFPDPAPPGWRRNVGVEPVSETDVAMREGLHLGAPRRTHYLSEAELTRQGVAGLYGPPKEPLPVPLPDAEAQTTGTVAPAQPAPTPEPPPAREPQPPTHDQTDLF